jgi:hypothetical protein
MGNFGCGVALLLNSAIFRAWKSYEYNNEMASRATLAWSPAALFLSGIFCFLFSATFQIPQEVEKVWQASPRPRFMVRRLIGEPGFVSCGASFGVELVVCGNCFCFRLVLALFTDKLRCRV